MMPSEIYTVYNPNTFKYSKGKYTDEHVYRFENMVAQNVTVPHKIHVIRSELPGWWGKIDLFEHKNVFYMDLSVAIINNIDHLLKFKTKFAALRDFIHINRLNSKVMCWQGDNSNVLNVFKANPQRIMNEYTVQEKWGDQDFIKKYIDKPDYLQDYFPNGIISYKHRNVSHKTCIIGFHGKPKPEETEYW